MIPKMVQVGLAHLSVERRDKGGEVQRGVNGDEYISLCNGISVKRGSIFPSVSLSVNWNISNGCRSLVAQAYYRTTCQ